MKSVKATTGGLADLFSAPCIAGLQWPMAAPRHALRQSCAPAQSPTRKPASERRMPDIAPGSAPTRPAAAHGRSRGRPTRPACRLAASCARAASTPPRHARARCGRNPTSAAAASPGLAASAARRCQAGHHNQQCQHAASCRCGIAHDLKPAFARRRRRRRQIGQPVLMQPPVVSIRIAARPRAACRPPPSRRQCPATSGRGPDQPHASPTSGRPCRMRQHRAIRAAANPRPASVSAKDASRSGKVVNRGQTRPRFPPRRMSPCHCGIPAPRAGSSAPPPRPTPRPAACPASPLALCPWRPTGGGGPGSAL